MPKCKYCDVNVPNSTIKAHEAKCQSKITLSDPKKDGAANKCPICRMINHRFVIISINGTKVYICPTCGAWFSPKTERDKFNRMITDQYEVEKKRIQEQNAKEA
jgi:adenine-specific DNA methylase